MPRQNRQTQRRPQLVCECGERLQQHWNVCQCGRVNARGRVRESQNRPTAELVHQPQSGNMNGSYRIFKMTDGSYVCDCLSFCYQRGVQDSSEGHGKATCKHLRDYFRSQRITPEIDVRPPTPYQDEALKRFGVESTTGLTNDQAYKLFDLLLEKQGIRYREWKTLISKYGKENLSMLPIYSFGVELEHYHTSSNGGMAGLTRDLANIGVQHQDESYNHNIRPRWKTTTDASIGGNCPDGYIARELVSPKLFGAHGFREMRKVMEVCEARGVKVNFKCLSSHVHIDAFYWNDEDLKRLGKVWQKIELPFLHWLVSKSRRANDYCKPINANWWAHYNAGGGFAGFTRDRFWGLNPAAYLRQKTIEIRLHQGTMDAPKLQSWVILLLKIIEKVKAGLTEDQITSTDPEFLLDLFGFGDGATTPLLRAREFLLERYDHFKAEAGQPPRRNARTQAPQETTPEAQVETQPEAPIEVQQEESSPEISEAVAEQHDQQVRDLFDSLTSSANPISSRAQINNRTVRHLATLRSVRSRQFAFDDLQEAMCENGNYILSRGSSRYAVANRYDDGLSASQGTLNCGCANYREYGHCPHTESVARHILAREEVINQ